MDPLWASLPNELRQLVVVAYVSIATSYELALAAPIDHAFLIAVRDERERRTTPWRGGTCSNDVNRSDVPNDRSWQYYFGPFQDGQPASPAEVERHTLARACDSGDLEVVRQQIAKGVVLDFFNDLDTPLLLAVQNGHATCVRALLVARASLLEVPCWDGDNAGLYYRALLKGNLDVVKVLTEFGMPRWGRSFALLGNECEVAELWAAEYCGHLQEEVREFLVATRKFNPRAGDPKVYLRLQAMEQIEQIQLPMEQSEGNHEQLCPRRAIRGLRFLAGCGNLSGHFDFQGTQYVDYDLDESGYEAVRSLLPVLRVIAQSCSLQEKVPAELHELINDVERLPDEKLADERLAQLEEELSQDQSDPVPGREPLWAEVKQLLRDYPRLWTDLVLPEGAEVGAGAEAEAGAATGAVKELLQQRPPSVSDDELQFLLRQSPEECLEAYLGIAEAAEHEADAGERARLVFLARAASIVVADACRLHRALNTKSNSHEREFNCLLGV